MSSILSFLSIVKFINFIGVKKCHFCHFLGVKNQSKKWVEKGVKNGGSKWGQKGGGQGGSEGGSKRGQKLLRNRCKMGGQNTEDFGVKFPATLPLVGYPPLFYQKMFEIIYTTGRGHFIPF